MEPFGNKDACFPTRGECVTCGKAVWYMRIMDTTGGAEDQPIKCIACLRPEDHKACEHKSEDCTKTCFVCGKLLCNNCDKKCKNCGTPVCKTCDLQSHPCH